MQAAEIHMKRKTNSAMSLCRTSSASIPAAARSNEGGQQQDREPRETEPETAQVVLPARTEPELAIDRGELHVPARPAQPLLPQTVDRPRLLGQHHGVRLEDHPPPLELPLEGRHRVLGERPRGDPSADGLEVRPRVQLRTAGEAGDRAAHVLHATGRELADHVLDRDEPREGSCGRGCPPRCTR